ncbi:claudin-34 [Amia ocellicauda]|uniref:claudin-34 n=1 Tax=Amia ocellicauda TaxID=2972642 RepID=UPI003463D6F8|nr:CLD4 protein [Amia calva]
MTYLANTAHLQFFSFWLGVVGWILSAVATGLIEWRVWYVSDTTVISSGVAWVGIWRVCFFSDELVLSEMRVMYCRSISVSDGFAPPEIFTAQGLMLVAVIAGALGKASSVYALRNVYFGIQEPRPIRVAFSLSGALFVFAGVCILIPIGWNLNSVLQNKTIHFPLDFHMPSSPMKQEPGAAIGVGIAALVLLILSGLLFYVYEFPEKKLASVQPFYKSTEDADVLSLRSSFSSRPISAVSRDLWPSCHSVDNPAFQSQEHLYS